MFAKLETTGAIVDDGTATARSSAMCAVAVAVNPPMPTPETKRATISPVTSCQSRNMTAATISTASAAMKTNRGPTNR
jgi:hypothetical protein